MSTCAVAVDTEQIAKLHVLYFVDGYFPTVGGAEMQALRLAQRLQQRGHTVEIAAPHLDRSRAREEIIQGVSVRKLWYPRVPGLSGVFYCLALALFAVRNGRRYHAVHVHMVDKAAPIFGLLYRCFSGVLVAKVSGATEFDGGILDPQRRGLKRNLFCRWLRGLRHIQTISDYTRERLLAVGVPEAQVLMLPNGIDTALFAAAETLERSTDVVRIAYCGRLVPEKGLANLLHAVAEVKQQTGVAFELLLAGDGPLRDELQTLANALSLQRQVRFLGQVDDVPGFLRQADMYTQPSQYEGLSNAILEAMSCQLPLVLTRISGSEDLVEQGVNGLLVPYGDVAALANALKEMLQDPSQRQRMGRASRARVQRDFALSTVVNRLEQLYRRETVL